MRFLGDPSLTEADRALLGGKALRLHELRLLGYAVPAGFVVDRPMEGLLPAIDRIGGFPVAVRSSGAMEDLGDASFAGLYETVLWVRSEDELRAAIEKCLSSADTPRVHDYLRQKGKALPGGKARMSVLVQRMVDAKLAGVLFTLDPRSGREEECYLEFCKGVGERLVGGLVTPSRISYDWAKGQLNHSHVNAEGATLGPELLETLVRACVRIQAHYGRPQDVEWAVDQEDRLHVLQARPITSWRPRQDRPELTNADFKDGGVSARVCTPFMYSVYREAVEVSMGEYFKKIRLIQSDEGVTWAHYHYGRVYWNAGAVKEGLKKIPGFREDAFDRDLGIQKDYGAKGPHRTKLTLGLLVNAVPVVLGLNQEFRDSLTMALQYRVRFEAKDGQLKEALGPGLARLPDAEFQRWFLEVILFQNETERCYFRIIYNNANFQSEFRALLKKVPAFREGDELDLMLELHGVSHMDVQAGLSRLRKVADFYGFHSQSYHRAREEFLRVHYHHGPAELDLLVPRWGERKDWVDDLVRGFSEASAHGSAGRFGQARKRLAASAGPFRRLRFNRDLKRSRDFLRVREELRAYSTRAYYLLRLGLLEFARRNGLSELDAFMLDVREVRRKLLRPTGGLPDTTHRRLLYEGYSRFTPPNEFGGAIEVPPPPAPGALRGLGCSPGEVTGRARVILDIHQTQGLTKSDVLVTAFTDPGWTPVLARVGGVVTEVGGLLSHAAVIGREYGIPAVLNLPGATTLIKDGDTIKVDGRTGVVEVLSEED